jgi:alpha-L-arabinofuranosidase
MVDEHYYVKPAWFWENLTRYDAYDRSRSAVYLGEYAAHEPDRRNTLRSALAEAAYLTALERNGDIVRLTSYAPLLCKQGHRHWAPDLIYFDNTRVYPSINYTVQRLFGENAGDTYLPTSIQTAEAPGGPTIFAASCVRDSGSGDLILKLVSRADTPTSVQIDLSSVAGAIAPTAPCICLSGDPLAENAFGQPARIVPSAGTVPAGKQFTCEAPAHSFSVIRIKTS